MTPAVRFCPKCGAPLAEAMHGGRPRPACAQPGCGFVHWGNLTPVVAAIVEHGADVLLVRAKGWPEKLFGLVTGFLEAGERPEDGVLRELREELGLAGDVVRLVGVYPFDLRNELIVAFHVRASGEITVGDELEGFKRVPLDKLRPWPFGTGLAVKDFLDARAAGGSGRS